MPTYVASGRDAQGNNGKQKVTANSLADARATLKNQGFFVQDLQEDKGFDLQAEINKFQTSMVKITVKEKAVFSRQFAVMVNAGVAMVRSLGILSEQCTNPKLKKALMEISTDVQQGNNLSEAMRKHPQCFDTLYVSMIQAGEIGGVLDEVLNRLAQVLEDTARLQNQIKSAMSYPVVVSVIAVAVFIGMTVFLLPTFANIFESIGTELPMFTQVMLGISKFLRTPQYSLGLIILFNVLMFVYQQYYKTRVGRETMDRLFLKMPLFGDLLEKTATARFCRTFGSLTRSGVPILTSLEIVRDTAGNQVISNAVDSARREIQTGGMISIALANENVFPVMAVQMISIGEETGELDQMLMKVADFYEQEVEEAVKALTSIMEPIMILFLGGMVASILLSMYLPMFKVFETLG
ncbi:MAG: type II secretion system F family protein [Leptolyngbyaceae bacterium]|nr:type II secretion system F family protein [Leptolyngbyaceae bacterium]